MIYCLTGKIVKKSLNAVVLSCGGVGYYTQCPASVAGALPGVGQETTLYTVMSVTENDISLYGFATEEQQSCFELLTAVSGVGPKVGLAILSVMEPDRVALAISAGEPPPATISASTVLAWVAVRAPSCALCTISRRRAVTGSKSARASGPDADLSSLCRLAEFEPTKIPVRTQGIRSIYGRIAS